jgi:acetyltransferase
MFIDGMLKDKYAGTIYPINRREPEIMGLKAYASVADVPGEVDLVVMAVPAQATLAAMEDAIRVKAKFAVVHAVGFSELGDEGKKLERQMVETAGRGGLRIVGPNCMGIFTSRGRVNTIVPYSRVPMDPGGVAFVGQSGWVAEMMLRLGSQRGLRFNGIISIGNQGDLRVEDLLEYWGNDPGTTVISAYIEGLKDPERFIRLAREIMPRKPVIAWKGGRSELGVRAAASHTGSLAGRYQVFRSVCEQTGITPASNMEDLLDLCVAFNSPVLPAGRKIGLLIEAGGGAVASCDACAREGINIPEFSREVQGGLADYLKDRVPPSSNRKNPVDLVWAPIGGAEKVNADCLEMILPEVDCCLVMTYAFMHDEWFRTRLKELRYKYKTPIFMVPANPPDQLLGLQLCAQDGLPTYIMPENAIRCLGAMIKRAEFLKSRC